MDKTTVALLFRNTNNNHINIGDAVTVKWDNDDAIYYIDRDTYQVFLEEVEDNRFNSFMTYLSNKFNTRFYLLDHDEYHSILYDAQLNVIGVSKDLIIAIPNPIVSDLILDNVMQEVEQITDELDNQLSFDDFINDLEVDELIKQIAINVGIDIAKDENKKSIIQEKEIEKKEETNMFSDLNFGGKIRGDQFRMSINGLAVRGKDSKYYTYNPASRELVEVTTGFFDQMNDLLFTMPALELEVGDVIIHQNKPYYITVAKDNVIKGISFEDMTEDTLVAKTNIFNQSYFVKVFNCLGTNNILGSNIASNPTLAFALMGGQDMDLSKILMLQAMQGDGEMTDFSSNPMMLMALMGKDNGGEMNDFIRMQALSQMTKSKKSSKRSEKAE